MKRIAFLMVALLLVGGVAMAQGKRGEKMDPKARAERMTEQMVKEFSLNDTQKKQVLDLNVAQMQKMAQKMGEKKDGAKAGKGDRKEMKAAREEYDAQLKKILTEDQYKKYTKQQADREKKMKEGHQRRNK